MKDPKNKVGRPTNYTDTIADEICEWIAEGKSLNKWCAIEGNQSRKTVYAWLDKKENIEFRNNYADARARQADYYAQEIIEIADDSSGDMITDNEGNERFDSEFAARSRIRIDARKWYASKVAPKKYGDKLDVTSDGEKIEGSTINMVGLSQSALDEIIKAGKDATDAS
jgi:hypothetical protein